MSMGPASRRAGSLRLNFLPLKMSPGFSAAEYAVSVANELLWGLEGLVGKEWGVKTGCWLQLQ